MLKSKRKFYTWSNNRIARVQLLLKYIQCVKYQVIHNCQHTLTKYDSLFTFVYTTEFIIAFCCSSPEQWIHCNSILINTCNLCKKKNKIKLKKNNNCFSLRRRRTPLLSRRLRDNLLIDYYDILKNEITAKQIVSCISSPN